MARERASIFDRTADMRRQASRIPQRCAEPFVANPPLCYLSDTFPRF